MPGKQIKSTVFRGFFNKQTQYKAPKGGKMTARKARELTPEELKINAEASLYRPVLRVAYLIRIVRTRQDALSAPQVLAAFKGLDKQAVQTALAVALRDNLLTQEQRAAYTSMGYTPRVDVQEVDLETEARMAACPMYDSDDDEVVDQGDWDDDWDNQNQNGDVSLMWAKPPEYNIGEAIQPVGVAETATHRARTRYLKNDSPLYEVVKPAQPPVPKPDAPVLPKVQAPNERKLIIGRPAPPLSTRPVNNIRGHRTRTKRQDEEVYLGEAFTGPATATTTPDNIEMREGETSDEGQAYEPVITGDTSPPPVSATTNGIAILSAATTTNQTIEMPKKKSAKKKAQADDPVMKTTTTPQPLVSPIGPVAVAQALTPGNPIGAANAATTTNQPTNMQQSEITSNEAQAQEPDNNELTTPGAAGLDQHDALLAELGLQSSVMDKSDEEDQSSASDLLAELGLSTPIPPVTDEAPDLEPKTALPDAVVATNESSETAADEEVRGAADDDQGQTVIETSASLQAVIEEVGATFLHMTDDIVAKIGARIDKGDERLIRVVRKTADSLEKHRLKADDLELRLASSEEALARAITQVAAQGDSIAALLTAVAGLTLRADAADLKTATLTEENVKLRAQVVAVEGKLVEMAARESDVRAEAIVTGRRAQSTIDKLEAKVRDLQANMLSVPPVAAPNPATAVEPPPTAGPPAVTWSTVTATPTPQPVVLKPRQRPVLKVIINGAEKTLSVQRLFGDIQDSLKAYNLEYVEATSTVIATPQTRDMQYKVGGTVMIYKLPATATRAEETKQAIALLNTSVVRQVDGVWEQHVLDVAESEKYIASTFSLLGQLPPVGTGPMEPAEAVKTFYAIRKALDYRTSQPAFKSMTAKQVAQEAARLHYSLELSGVMAAIKAADRDAAAKMDRPHVRKVLTTIATATSTPPAWVTLAAEIGQFEPIVPDGVATHPTHHAPVRQPSARGAARGRGRGGATLSAFMRPQPDGLSFLTAQQQAAVTAGSPAATTPDAITPA